MKNMGIYNIQFNFENSTENKGILFPAYPSFSVLKYHQYWNFSYFENDSRFIPIPFFYLDKNLMAIRIKFEVKGYEFIFPITNTLYNWIENIILHSSFSIEFYTILPIIFNSEEWKNNKIILDGFDMHSFGPKRMLIQIDNKDINNLVKDFKKIIPNISPMIESNLKKIKLPYNEEELKHKTNEYFKTHQSLNENKQFLISLEKYMPFKNVDEFMVKMKQPFKINVMLSQISQDKVIIQSYYKVIQSNDEDITLQDLKNNLMIAVELDNLPINLNEGEIIKVKLISFPKDRMTQIWHFYELKTMRVKNKKHFS